jgi:hypothetical protein
MAEEMWLSHRSRHCLGEMKQEGDAVKMDLLMEFHSLEPNYLSYAAGIRHKFLQ